MTKKEKKIAAILERRLTTAKLLAMHPDERQKAILVEKYKCSISTKYLIETYFLVPQAPSEIPFVLMPHQKEALEDYIKFPNNITMKTRQMGFTTFTSAFIAAELIMNNNFSALIISKEQRSSMDFLKNIKDILDQTRKMTKIGTGKNDPSWLVPDYKEGYNNKQSFELENMSKVQAQGNTEDAGRGISGLNLAVVDEVAFIDRKSPQKMNDIWAALGPALSTVKGKTIMISTPFGSSGWYYDTYTNAQQMGFNIIDAHWTKHPLFNMGQYQWIRDDSMKDGGFIKFYNDTWPETLFDKESGVYIEVPKEKYIFNRDGNIRSPWYDFESNKLGPRKTSCELDCTFVGTGGEVFGIDILRSIKLFSESTKYSKITSSLGLMSDYKEYMAPQEGHKYVLASDVATGDGSDFSTITIMDLNTLQVCGTYKGQPFPKAFASIIMELATRFNKCWVVIENAGGGGTVLQELKDMRYPNIYYSTLNKKDESLGVSKRKIGLWISESVRDKGGDKLEEYIRQNMLFIPDTRLSDEFFNWIWDKDGKRRHAPGKHDDLIIALQHAIYYHAYVHKRNARNRSNFSAIFDIQRTDGEFNGILEQDIIPFNPYSFKKNNGRDIIDQKRNFYAENNKEHVRRSGMFI